MFSTWNYIAVALVIALAAFGLGQLVPGLGVPFVVLASTAWVSYAASRYKRADRGR